MLVHSCFEGDDVPLARRQHDVYGEALHQIVQACERHVQAACRVLDLAEADFWHAGKAHDHRTMQVAHDLLAARWRHLVRPPQMDLFACRRALMSDWLNWLRAELDDWSAEPELVAALRRVLWFQNATLGYAAEDALRRKLLARYNAVPWTAGIACRRTW